MPEITRHLQLLMDSSSALLTSGIGFGLHKMIDAVRTKVGTLQNRVPYDRAGLLRLHLYF
jgi:hypothetical protein